MSASVISLVPAEAVDVESVTLNFSSVRLWEGESIWLIATVKPDNADNKAVTWGSSSSRVASVDANGWVFAKRGGSAYITATTNNGKNAECYVYVRYWDGWGSGASVSCASGAGGLAVLGAAALLLVRRRRVKRKNEGRLP